MTNQSIVEKPPLRTGVVVYDSRFGNTKRIAESLGLGLNETGIPTVCLDVKDVMVHSLRQYDLICVGAPTEKFSASDSMKEFLERLKSVDLSRKNAFAFDTKVSPGIFGSAAKYIEKELNKQGLRVITLHESATVSTTRSGGEITGAKLRDGEEKKFEEIGKRIGTSLARVIPA